MTVILNADIMWTNKLECLFLIKHRPPKWNERIEMTNALAYFQSKRKKKFCKIESIRLNFKTHED
jgi:hypothetical protein